MPNYWFTHRIRFLLLATVPGRTALGPESSRRQSQWEATLEAAKKEAGPLYDQFYGISPDRLDTPFMQNLLKSPLSKELLASAKLLNQIKHAKDYGVKSATAEFDFAEAMERVKEKLKIVLPLTHRMLPARRTLSRYKVLR
jgi:hypothetical protein